MIVRTYQCADCQAMYEVECNSNDGDPDCPACSTVLQWRPQSFAIGGSIRSKAVDLTQNIMEKDFGLADMKDNVREGEAYFKPPPPKQAAEIEAETRRDIEITNQTGSLPPDLAAQVEHSRNTFFGAGGALGGMGAMMSTAAASKGQPGSVDAMGALHQGGKEGKLPTRARIIARG
jgi:hypothetical protein